LECLLDKFSKIRIVRSLGSITWHLPMRKMELCLQDKLLKGPSELSILGMKTINSTYGLPTLIWNISLALRKI